MIRIFLDEKQEITSFVDGTPSAFTRTRPHLRVPGPDEHSRVLRITWRLTFRGLARWVILIVR